MQTWGWRGGSRRLGSFHMAGGHWEKSLRLLEDARTCGFVSCEGLLENLDGSMHWSLGSAHRLASNLIRNPDADLELPPSQSDTCGLRPVFF